MYNIICKNCSKEHTAKGKHAKFCCERCRTTYNRNNRGTKQTCIRCSSVFYKYKITEHCTNDCKLEGQKELSIKRELLIRLVKAIDPARKKKCLNCNEIFYANNIGRMYCNDRCHYDDWYSNIKANRTIHDKTCVECEEEYSTTRPKSKYCSRTCRRKSEWRKEEIRRNIKLKENGNIDWDINLKSLFQRDNGKCYLCNCEVNMDEHHNHNLYGSIDHVIPISKGGTHTWDNVKLAHRKCNSLKGSTMIL